MRVAFTAASQENSSPSALSSGQALRGEGHIVARRAADAYRNSPILSNAIRILRRAVLGYPRPIATGDEERADDAQAAWDEWARWCGYRHNAGSLASVLMRAAHGLCQDGEVFIQRVWVNNARHRNGLLLQVWPARLLDRTRLMLEGKDVVDGIEFADGLPVAAWFRARSSDPIEWRATPTRVSFDDLIWLRYAPEGDQIGGTPPTHAAIESDAQLADYAQTALTQQRVAACTAAMILAEAPALSRNLLELGTRVTDAFGHPVEELQPGTFAVVHGAKEIKTLSPDAAHFPVEEHVARVAAGAGLTAEIVAGRLGAASYSAARHAMLLLDDVVAELREVSNWSSALVTLVNWWRGAELMAGHDWDGIQFAWLPTSRASSVDPVKTAEADRIEIELGIKSVSQAIRERYRDPAEVFRERQREQELINGPGHGPGATEAPDVASSGRRLHAA